MADTLPETTEHNRRIEDGVFTLAANPADKVARAEAADRCRRSTSRP
jgi:hypothetical protein